MLVETIRKDGADGFLWKVMFRGGKSHANVKRAFLLPVVLDPFCGTSTVGLIGMEYVVLSSALMEMRNTSRK